MFRDDILDIFKYCTFECLNEGNYEDLILQNLPINFNYSYTYGASKLVIIPKDEKYVIKIPFEGYTEDGEFYNFGNANWDVHRFWDYCLTEVLTYNNAKNNKVEKILAKTKLIGEVEPYHPIYVQERAVTYENIEDDKVINNDFLMSKVRKICFTKKYRAFNLDWITDIYNYYGEKNFDKIMQFITSIGDLHDDNVGYIGSRPVILDYSDFLS